jgi:hypothetical protein
MSIDSLRIVVSCLYDCKRKVIESISKDRYQEPLCEDEYLIFYITRKSTTVYSLFEDFKQGEFENISQEMWNKLCRFINNFLKMYQTCGPLIGYEYIILKLDFLIDLLDTLQEAEIDTVKIMIILPTDEEIECYGF